VSSLQRNERRMQLGGNGRGNCWKGMIDVCGYNDSDFCSSDAMDVDVEFHIKSNLHKK
jgi:hypothetical protein